ncbi:uncharacterized protein LOC119590920 [Penaeus monodon]|uniref:uncharacterized protein LOC119590920 n=1 Tax=Penaeus monodon TaxID=6687 RepID=UPI0018A79940|nr:uncharacterized protein LOC119590920 [Penaeus monodon]XP_037795587.1 uncharacterized protein LOC119590920 [Penaeus monodon]
MLGIHKFGFLVGFVGYAAALSVLQPENILEGFSSFPSHHIKRRQASTGNLQTPVVLNQGNSILNRHRFQLGLEENSQNRPDSSEDSSLESLKDSNASATSRSRDSGSEAPRITLRTSPIQARTRTAGVVFPTVTPEPSSADVTTLSSPSEERNFGRSLSAPITEFTGAETTPLPGAPSPFDPNLELFDVGTRVIVTAPPRPCPGVCEFRARNGRCFENFNCFRNQFLL